MYTLLFSILMSILNLDPNYIGHCLLNSPMDEKVPVYAASSGDNVIGYLVNDGYYEDYPDLFIKEKQNGRVLIDAQYKIWGERRHDDESGWIDMEYLGTYLNEGFLTKKLYDSPRHDAKVLFRIKNNEVCSGMYKVVDVYNYWLKIKVTGTDVQGWLPPEFSETTSDGEEEKEDKLPLIFIDTTKSSSIPIYEHSTGNEIKEFIIVKHKRNAPPHILVLACDEGKDRAQGYICDGSRMINMSGWIDCKYLVTYLNPQYDIVEIYDSYEDGNVIFSIDNTNKNLAYQVIGTWHFGWVKIFDPRSKKEGWLAPYFRSETCVIE